MGARSVTPQSGGDSLILLGRQTAWGTPVRTFDAPGSNKAGFIQRRFVFTRNTLDVAGEFEQSDSVLGDGNAPPQILSRIVPSGQYEEELLPEDIVHFVAWSLNVTEEPTNTEVAAKTIGATTASATGHTYEPAANARVAPTTSGRFPWPQRVRVTLSGSAMAGAGAQAVFTGVTNVGATERGAGTETINIPSGSVTNIDSALFFNPLTSVEITGLTAAGTGAISYIGGDTNMVSLTPGSLSGGLVAFTAQMRKGTTPVSAFDVVSTNATITMGNNVRLLQDVRASRVLNKRLILSDSVEVERWDEENTPDGAPDFDYPNLNFARAWGTAVTFGEVDSSDIKTAEANDTKIVTTNNVVLGVNNNLEDSPGNTGNPSAGQPIVGDAGRQITLQIDKSYETGDDSYDWQSIFRSSSTVPIIVRSYNFDGKGRQYLVEYRLANAKLSEAPAIPVEGRGTITQTLNFESPTIEVNIWSATGFSNGAGS